MKRTQINKLLLEESVYLKLGMIAHAEVTLQKVMRIKRNTEKYLKVLPRRIVNQR